MFIEFFYTLRDRGVPVTPTSFLRLQKALNMGAISTVEDFYTGARSILVKSERYFDIYDQVFAHHFEGVAFQDPGDRELGELARALLEEWLRNPRDVAATLGLDRQIQAKTAGSGNPARAYGSQGLSLTETGEHSALAGVCCLARRGSGTTDHRPRPVP